MIKNLEVNVGPLFKKSKMLNLNQLNNIGVGLFMYDYIKGYLPSFFDNYFILNNKVHKHNTRKSNLIHKKRIRTNYGKFSVKNKGTEIWNKILKKVRDSSTKTKFKRK